MLDNKRNTSDNKLPESQALKIQEIVDQIEENMTFSERLSLLKKAWGMLPQAKLDWDYSVSLLRFFCMECIEAGEYKEGEKWLELLFKSPFTDVDPAPYEFGGIILYKLGRLDESFSMIARLENLMGNRGLRGLPPDVRNFYVKSKGQ